MCVRAERKHARTHKLSRKSQKVGKVCAYVHAFVPHVPTPRERDNEKKSHKKIINNSNSNSSAIEQIPFGDGTLVLPTLPCAVRRRTDKVEWGRY
jgi:hypothetical protein